MRWSARALGLCVACLVYGSQPGTLAAAGPEKFTITADRVSYDPSGQVATALGNLVIDQGPVQISAAEGTFRARTGESLLSGSVRLKAPDREVQSERLLGQHRAGVYRFTGQVLYRQPTVGLTVTADRLIYRARSQEAEFDGAVHLTFRDRIVTAESATVTPAVMTLKGDVLSEQLYGPPVVPVIYIAAQDMAIDPVSGDARFWGEVVMSKLDRIAKGDRATHSEKSRQVQLFPSKLTTVFIDDGLTYTSQQVNYDFEMGEFSTPGRKQLNLRIQSPQHNP